MTKNYFCKTCKNYVQGEVEGQEMRTRIRYNIDGVRDKNVISFCGSFKIEN